MLRWMVGVLAVTGAGLAAPGAAEAATFCVDRPACVAGGGTAQPGFGEAIAAAQAAAGADRIELGPGRFVGPFAIRDDDPVDVSGVAGTVLDVGVVPGAERAALSVDAPGSVVEDLRIEVSATQGPVVDGLQLTGRGAGELARRVQIREAPGAATRHGAVVRGAARLEDGTIDLGPGGRGERGGAVGDGTLRRVSVSGADVGVWGIGGTLRLRHVRVEARQVGVVGSVDVDRALVRITGAGTDVRGVLLQPTTAAGTVFGVGPTRLRHVTVLGAGGGAGIVAQGRADVGGVGGPAGGVDAEVTLRDSIVDGFAAPVLAAGEQVTAGGTTHTGTGRVAADYSSLALAAVDRRPFGAFAAGVGNVDGDPRLAAGDDPEPLADSPVVDAGDPAPPAAGEEAVDLLGRPFSGRRDMGAFERTPPPVSAAPPAQVAPSSSPPAATAPRPPAPRLAARMRAPGSQLLDKRAVTAAVGCGPVACRARVSATVTLSGRVIGRLAARTIAVPAAGRRTVLLRTTRPLRARLRAGLRTRPGVRARVRLRVRYVASGERAQTRTGTVALRRSRR